MRGSSFGYLVKEGARSLYANRLMSFASIGVLVACLLLIGSAFLFSINVNGIIRVVEDQNEVVLFAEDDIGQDTLDQIEQELSTMDNIKEYEFISKQQALENEKERMGDAAVLLEGLSDEENPYPDSFRVKIDNLDELDYTMVQLRALPDIYEIVAPTEVADTVTSIKHGVTLAGIVIVAILGIVSLVIIANTIRITVFNRRKEISIMKHVGATDRFIRLPFLVEGILLGLISALLAFFLIWGGYHYLTNWILQSPSQTVQFVYANLVSFRSVALYLLGGFAGIGVLVGAIGSTVFVGKHLKV